MSRVRLQGRGGTAYDAKTGATASTTTTTGGEPAAPKAKAKATPANNVPDPFTAKRLDVINRLKSCREAGNNSGEVGDEETGEPFAGE